MTTQQSLLAVIGALLPLVIALVNQAHWPAQAKGLVALAACVVAATVTEYVQGHVNLTDWRTAVVVVTGAALVSYRALWKSSGIADWLERLTSFGDTPATPAEPTARVTPAP